jgi:hypothetical protein
MPVSREMEAGLQDILDDRDPPVRQLIGVFTEMWSWDQS